MLRLNLLPAERKRSWALTQKLRQWRGTMLVIVIVCAFANGTMFILDRYLDESVTSSTDALADWRELTAKRESGQITAATKKANATITGLQNLFVPATALTGAASAFLAELPTDIRVTVFRLATDGTFTMQGTANTRAAFLALRTALDENSHATNIATSSVASSRENVPFEYTGQIIQSP